MYLDDILVFSRTLKDHMHTLERIFKRFEENGLAISLKKCRFGEQSIEFVGYNISREGIKPLPRKLHAISSFPAPQKQKHLLGFLGAIKYYRRIYSSHSTQQQPSSYRERALWLTGKKMTWIRLSSRQKSC